MTPRVIVVDTETTGLDLERDYAVEVAWQDYHSGEAACFVPFHNRGDVLERAHPTALEINGYRQRIMPRPQDLGLEVGRMWSVLEGATLVASAPAIDLAMLARMFSEHALAPRPWHHRVVDLGSYAAGRLGIPLHAVPGLWVLANALEVETPDHGAAQDVSSLMAVMRRLEDSDPIELEVLGHRVLELMEQREEGST